MNLKNWKKAFSLSSLLFFTLLSSTQAQDYIKVSGRVIDAADRSALPFATVSTKNAKFGVTTDLDGFYELKIPKSIQKLQASLVGYKPLSLNVVGDSIAFLDFVMQTQAVQMKTVEVKARKRVRYKRKGNPAIWLINQVISHREENHVSNLEQVSFDKYEKFSADVNNFKEKLANSNTFQKLDFTKYVKRREDSSLYLPMFIRENAYKINYKNGHEKSFHLGESLINIQDFFKEKSIKSMLDLLYQDVDIRQKNIFLIDYNFASPFSAVGSKFYRYYLKDTFDYQGEKVVKLIFSPFDKQSISFEGEMYVSVDSSYKVLYLDMKTREDINLNFTENLHIRQEFKTRDGVVVKTKELLEMDAILYQGFPQVHIKREQIYSDYVNDLYDTPKIREADLENQVAQERLARMDSLRPNALNAEEQGIYDMAESLNTNRWFRNRLMILKVLSTGYHSPKHNKFIVGNFLSSVNYNRPEGYVLRLGYKTLPKLHPRINNEAYLSYGTNDQKFKYAFNLGYSLTKPFDKWPERYIDYTYRDQVRIPGQAQGLISYEAFYTTLRAGDIQNFLHIRDHRISFLSEYENNFGFQLDLTKGRYQGYGDLNFKTPEYTYGQDTGIFDNSEVKLSFTYAPNQKFLRNKTDRFSLITRYPILKFSVAKGISDVLGSNHDYWSFDLSSIKRVNMNVFGYSYTYLRAGKMIGNVPATLMYTPTANSGISLLTSILDLNLFNMQRDMEFITDQYVQFQLAHYFNGFFTYKIPLIEKLNVREIVTFRTLWGSLTPSKNQEITNLQSVNTGAALRKLDPKVPYIEASVGLENIFKILRVDLVRRFTYLDNHDLDNFYSWGPYSIRVRVTATL